MLSYRQIEKADLCAPSARRAYKNARTPEDREWDSLRSMDPMKNSS